jgi:uncharacterized protein (DUF2267 family)
MTYDEFIDAVEERAHVPRDQAEKVTTATLGLEEFERRVAERAGVPISEAEQDVRAVLTTIREAITGGEFDDLINQLPDEFWKVIEPTSWRGEGRN